MSGGVSKLQSHASCDEHAKSDIVGSFSCVTVLCVRTQVQISLCDMKMSPGHSRPHLATATAAGMCTLHEKEGRNSLVFQDRIGVCHMQTNMHKKASERCYILRCACVMLEMRVCAATQLQRHCDVAA